TRAGRRAISSCSDCQRVTSFRHLAAGDDLSLAVDHENILSVNTVAYRSQLAVGRDVDAIACFTAIGTNPVGYPGDCPIPLQNQGPFMQLRIVEFNILKALAAFAAKLRIDLFFLVLQQAQDFARSWKAMFEANPLAVHEVFALAIGLADGRLL